MTEKGDPFFLVGTGQPLKGMQLCAPKGQVCCKISSPLTSSTKMSEACSARHLIFSPPNAVSFGWYWLLKNVGTISLVFPLLGRQHHCGPHTSSCL